MKPILRYSHFIYQSKHTTSLKSPLKFEVNKAFFCDSRVNVTSKIEELETELKELKEVLPLTTGEEKLVIRKQIAAAREQLTLWMKRQPKPGENFDKGNKLIDKYNLTLFHF